MVVKCDASNIIEYDRKTLELVNIALQIA